MDHSPEIAPQPGAYKPPWMVIALVSCALLLCCIGGLLTIGLFGIIATPSMPPTVKTTAPPTPTPTLPAPLPVPAPK